MLSDYGKLGVKLMITELDINVLPRDRTCGAPTWREGDQPCGDATSMPTGLPDEQQQELARRYADIFRLLLEASQQVARVTFWGVHDGQSWLNDCRPRPRTIRCCSIAVQPKPAFDAVGRQP